MTPPVTIRDVLTGPHLTALVRGKHAPIMVVIPLRVVPIRGLRP